MAKIGRESARPTHGRIYKGTATEVKYKARFLGEIGHDTGGVRQGNITVYVRYIIMCPIKH